MKANRILQCESELKRLKRTLKRLKQQSVTVTLTGTKQPLRERGVKLLIGFIDVHFDILVYQDEYIDDKHVFVLRAYPEDIARVLRLAATQTDDVELHKAFINLSQEVYDSAGNTQHFL